MEQNARALCDRFAWYHPYCRECSAVFVGIGVGIDIYFGQFSLPAAPIKSLKANCSCCRDYFASMRVILAASEAAIIGVCAADVGARNEI